MAEARGNLSIMGWGATLLSYAMASMAYAGLFTTEPVVGTGGFGTLSSFVFFIGIAFFIIGLVMHIFGGKETETAAGTAPGTPPAGTAPGTPGTPPAGTAPGTPGGPPAPGGPGAPPPPGGPRRWRRVGNFLGRHFHNTVGQFFKGLRGKAPTAPTPVAPTAPRAGLPSPSPRRALPSPFEEQLKDWVRRLDENSLPPSQYPPTDSIFKKKFEIDTKTPILRNIHQVFEEVISQRKSFQHPDIIGPRSRFLQNLTDDDNFFREIFQRVDRLKASRELGEQKRIRHELNRFTNEQFHGYNRWLWRNLRKEHRERTGREMEEETPKEETGRAEKAPREEKPLKVLPAPKKKKAKKTKKKAEPYYAKIASDEEEALLREKSKNNGRKREPVGVGR